MLPQVGQAINGKYRLTRLIGEGGMGSVFEASHEYLGNVVALKFLNPDLAQRPGLVARFLQEARVSASIRSPHVVQVSDVDQTADGLPYLVMELLDGESLQAVITRVGRLPMGIALDYTVQMLNGLEAAHAHNVVHRDLKPDNVFIVSTPQGPLVKLLDFGIAKLRTSEEFQRGLTRPGVLMGTPEYMAPEQAFSAGTVDHRADLYSVGVIAFEMLAGRRPVDVDDPRVMAARIVSGNVPKLIELVSTVSPGLSDVVARALAGHPENRYASAGEMRGAILPFFTVSANAAGVGAYPSLVAVTPPVPNVKKKDTAVLARPERPAPTQPGSEPGDVGGGVSPTEPGSDAAPDPRTGTVLGGPSGLGNAGSGTSLGDYAGTAAMPPMDFGSTAPDTAVSPAYGLPPGVPRAAKSKRSVWTILGVLAALLGALAAIVVIGFYVVQQDPNGSDPPIATFAPPATVTSDPVTTPGTTTSPYVPPTVPPATTTAVRPPVRRDGGVADAGAEAGLFPDASFPLPPFPSSIPSGLIPPFPIPSGLPTFPLPGWGQPPPN